MTQVKDQEEEKKRQERKTTPHFWNLNEDPQLTGMVVHLIGSGTHRIGNRKATPPPEILMNGLSIQEEHAVVENRGKFQVALTPGRDTKILINGEPVQFEVLLHHNDRQAAAKYFHRAEIFTKQYFCGLSIDSLL